MSDKDDRAITLRILWTTTGICQPYVSIAIKTEMIDDERQRLLQDVADFITVGRKRQGDTVEAFIGRPVEDHIAVTCNAFHFAKPSKTNTIAAPAMVKWLRKDLPSANIFPPGRLKIAVVWMKPGTREMHEQP